MVLAVLLYEQFIHHKQIDSCPHTILSTQQRAYHSFSGLILFTSLWQAG